MSVCSATLLNAFFVTPSPQNAIQIASAYHLSPPMIEFTISAIAVGIRSGAEMLPDFSPYSNVKNLRSALAQFRRKMGGKPQDGPTAILFGQPITGLMSVIYLPGATAPRLAVLTEWVTIAGPRLWIIREAEPYSDGDKNWSSLSPNLIISGDNVDTPSSSLDAQLDQPSIQPGKNLSEPQAGLPNLPTPGWWNGPCDTFNYYKKTGDKYFAYPLGTSYRNVVACGPSPNIGGGLDEMVFYFPGAWGQLEWECVELSMRFIYLAYGVVPYKGNGNQVVQNYAGSVFNKVTNGTPGKYPVAGDVLSYCATCTYGHTSVVMDSKIDLNGTGTVTVLEQNNSPTGTSMLKASNWTVFGDTGPIIGWLHPANDPTGTSNLPLYLPFVQR